LTSIKDYEAMNNPDLLDYLEEHKIKIPASLHNELSIIRGVTHDPQADAARDKVINLLRHRENRAISKRTLVVSVITAAIAIATLLVVIIKR
jgi:hypothetical protein